VVRINRTFTTHRHTPHEKPLALFAGMIELLSEPGQTVCDLFVSSGTTMLAAENQGRRCLAMELNPGYVAVTLQRYRDATGKRPEKKDEIDR